jgi:hypothetical protein
MNSWLIWGVLGIYVLFLSVIVVNAAELNSLNTIDYNEGQTIELSTKLLDVSESVGDASCGVMVVANYDNLTRLEHVQMSYDEIDQKYVYEWMPTLTWWEDVQQIWNPSIGEYTAYMNCSGGTTLNETMLNDAVLIRVVD